MDSEAISFDKQPEANGGPDNITLQALEYLSGTRESPHKLHTPALSIIIK
jgi:hypothetical protein